MSDSVRPEKYTNIPAGIKYDIRDRRLRFLKISLFEILLKIPFLAKKFVYLNVNERLADYAFVHQNLNLPDNGKILDIGSNGNRLVLELAISGFDVYGLDPLGCSFSHPELSIIIGDICQSPFSDNSFDVVTAVSTLEHIGLGRWGDPQIENADRVALSEIRRILKSGGKLIMTVPFGKTKVVYHGKKPLHKIYDCAAVKLAFSDTGLKIVKFSTIIKQGDFWVKNPFEIAEQIEYGETICGDALIVAQKE